jgi:hypothetical protein
VTQLIDRSGGNFTLIDTTLAGNTIGASRHRRATRS